MKKTTIYAEQSQELLRLFEEVGNNAKIMCVQDVHFFLNIYASNKTANLTV